MHKIIPFSPPDITDNEIEAVVNVLKSGWITSGVVNKEFEEELCKYINVKRVKVLSSATMAMELALKIFGVAEGDEVIVPAYTYASTANAAIHLGAKVVFIDAASNNDFNIDLEKLENAITSKTKAVIAVDIGGKPCDYDGIIKILEKKKDLFTALNTNKYQKQLNRALFLLDAAHSIGAFYKGNRVGSQADFSSFSFHAVKNVTTAEGGALSFNDIGDINADEIYRELSVWALNGQTKSALDKTKLGSWRYDIEAAGYKCNMSDIHAAIGLSQLRRYDEMLKNRKNIVNIYNSVLSASKKVILPVFKDDESESSYHLYLLRIKDYEEADRDLLIEKMAELGIVLNVHYLPLPFHNAYKAYKDYDNNDYKNAFNLYKNEVTLPLYSTLKEEDALYIAKNIFRYLESN